MIKNWIAKELPDEEVVNGLMQELKVNHYIATLIAQRKLTNYLEARKYFAPDLNDLHDPFLMKNMLLAVTRINKSITSNEKILIYGDYDVDGTTAVAVVYRFLNSFYQNLIFYVPDRFCEGYGISLDGIDLAASQGVKLIIALDCGIKDVDKITYANSLGLEVIVCDHHTPGQILPPAFAILNPKQIDCEYPYKELSGCGIGFKLIQAYSAYYYVDYNTFELIDYVAVSIASDIVPMTGENRTLAFMGLKKINEDPSVPFSAMLSHLETKKALTITDLVFIIGPRLNASGRVSHAKTTVQFLIEQDFLKSIELVSQINSNNLERKDIDLNTLEEALDMIHNSEELQNKKTTVLSDPSWHKGVIGIVASRLIESFYRPTVLFAESDGYLTGSARSVAGFNLYEALEKCKSHLERFGGHQFAAGLTMKKENFEKFSECFEKVVSESITEDLLVPSIEYDIILPLEAINLSFIKTLDRFAPFGPGNMKPRFVTKNVKLNDDPRIVGHNHLKLNIQIPGYKYLSAIAFGMGEYYDQLELGKEFDICYTLEENIWNNVKSIQISIKDIHV